MARVTLNSRELKFLHIVAKEAWARLRPFADSQKPSFDALPALAIKDLCEKLWRGFERARDEEQ